MTVFFDLETTGLSPHQHQICQIAAVAVSSSWETGGTFEKKLWFNAETADPEALKKNSFDTNLWAEEAVSQEAGLDAFDAFLRRNADVEKVSKRGRRFRVAQVAGHNIASFDVPFLKAAFKWRRKFLPVDFICLDTLALAAWKRFQGELETENLKLETLAKHYGIEHNAHDALGDVVANVEIARRLLGKK